MLLPWLLALIVGEAVVIIVMTIDSIVQTFGKEARRQDARQREELADLWRRLERLEAAI